MIQTPQGPARVVVLDFNERRQQVKLGVEAPREVPVWRGEIAPQRSPGPAT